MYATQHNILQTPPPVNAKGVAYTCLVYPDHASRRIAEGGLRTQHQYKASLPDKPLLSIVTVVYNRVQVIERCIQSVLSQNYDNVEYIVIDGGSTDGTLDVLHSYQDAIDYFISEPDEGIYDAMNKGIRLAGGDVINFMNSDDYFMENVFADYVHALLHKDVVAVSAFSEIRDHNNKVVVKSHNNDSEKFIFFMSGAMGVCSHQTYFIRRQVFEELGYFCTDYRLAADYKFLLSMLIRYPRHIYTLEKDTVVFSSTGVSGDSDARIVGAFENAAVQWECYGKELGISKSLLEALTGHEKIVQQHVLTQFLQLYLGNTDPTKKVLWDRVFTSLCFFLEQHVYRPCIALRQDYWYVFGQLPARKKMSALCKKICATLYRMVVRRNS